MAKADHADADFQLPFAEADELPAAATLRNPVGRLPYGFAHRTQLFGSAAPACHYNCLSRAIASLRRRHMRIPRIGCYDDFGIAVTKIRWH